MPACFTGVRRRLAAIRRQLPPHLYLLGRDQHPPLERTLPDPIHQLPPSLRPPPPPSPHVVENGAPYFYVSNGGYPGDAGDYQGHVTTITLATGAQNVFNTMCSDQTVHFVISPGSPDCSGGVQSAVWARPGVIYDSDLDKIFFGTGNGTYDTTKHFWGDSILALNPDGTGSGGSPIDAYTPVEFQNLQNSDADLGSTAPAVLPPIAGSNVAHLAVQSGKDGQLRLLNLDNLSGAGGPGHIGGELRKNPVPPSAHVAAHPAERAHPARAPVR